MTSILTRDHYEKFRAFEKDYLDIEADIRRLYENIDKNKILLNSLDSEISPLLDSLEGSKNLRLPLDGQKGIDNFSQKSAEKLKKDLDDLSSRFGYGRKSLFPRIYHKAKSILTALAGIIFRLDRVYYSSLYNARLLEHYREWIQFSITEIQDNLFIQQSINRDFAAIFSKTMLLIQKFNEVSIDHTIISELKQKDMDTRINLLNEKEKLLMGSLMQEESFREYFRKIENYKENINRLMIKIHEALEKGIPDERHEAEAEKAISDQLYYEFEEVFRGDRHKIKLYLQQYIDIVKGRQPVVDIGCGRGEFLELLGENNIRGWGVDSNPCMTGMCRGEDIQIYNKDALSYIRDAEDQSIGAIFSSHLLEHLNIGSIEMFLRQAFRVLKKDGILIIETLDPSSFIGYHYYYLMDPTHRTPIHPHYIRFLADSIGYEDSFIYRPVKDYDSIMSEGMLNGIFSREESPGSRKAFRHISEKLGDVPEFALIAKKGN